MHLRHLSQLGVALVLAAGWSIAGAQQYVPVPGASFESILSNENGKATQVKVAPFSMRSTPVTNREFRRFIDAQPEWSPAQIPAVFAGKAYLQQIDARYSDAKHGNEPVTNVSWFAAQAYCESEGGRLPSWYEWEYVAASDAKRADARKDPAWRKAILDWYSRPTVGHHGKVGGASNFYGVRDMHGLIWEWVEDFNAILVSADSRNQGDPEKLQYCGAGAISLQDRENFAILMRVALLSALKGGDSTNDLGFRCVRDANGDKK